MQTHYPSDDFGTPATGKRILIALGLAMVFAIALIAIMRDGPMQTDESTSAKVPNATAIQPLESVGMARVGPTTEAPERTFATAQQPKRFMKIVPDFDNAARAALQESVQKSIDASLTRLGDDLALTPEN